MPGDPILTLIWAGIIGLAIFIYVVTDGFDLGIGILFPVLSPGPERETAIATIKPVWDANQTWLVLGGGGVFAAFPLAYAILMPAVYAPLIAMLLGLIFRGVAFKFRARTSRIWLWDGAFFAGSTLAAFSQGVILGAVLQGVKVSGRSYAGGWWDWLSPFSMLTGASVVAAYALLGACWLIWRTQGAVQDHAYRMAWRGGAASIAAIAAVSLATPFLSHDYFSRWFEAPGLYYSAPVPILLAVSALLFVRALQRRAERAPFFLAQALFALTFLGLGISIFPWAVPGQVTIWQAATAANAQVFMLFGVGALLPVILGYTGYAYWLFRGKVGAEGYG
jgi:cytochrome bd ubiquinol oxidase subunit II